MLCLAPATLSWMALLFGQAIKQERVASSDLLVHKTVISEEFKQGGHSRSLKLLK